MGKLVLLIPFFSVLLLHTTLVSAENPHDILIITNKSAKLSKVPEGELRNIFLGKKFNWDTGLRAVPVHSKNSALRSDFRDRLLHMNDSEESRYWQQYQIKTGKSEPPSFSNPLKAVFKLRGSVSYIYRSQYKEGIVDVVMVLPAP